MSCKQVIVNVLLANLVGWKRARVGKAAGVCNPMLVGMGAISFVLRFREYDENMRFDPLRIINAVVTGISFLGPGPIFVARGDQRVKGLTTAASIWGALGGSGSRCLLGSREGDPPSCYGLS